MAQSVEVWTIKAALAWCCDYLKRRGDENPRLSAEWLLAYATGLRRVELYVNYDRPLSFEERRTLREGVERRGAGEPLQYITGEVAFRHIAVKVRSGVLIPRPETEVLVSEALALLPAPARRRAVDSALTEQEAQELLVHAATAAQRGEEAFDQESAEGLSLPMDAAQGEGNSDDVLASRPLYVADVGTGSGCIACSVAFEHPDTRVIATDVSREACALARTNVAALGLDKRVYVAQGSLGTAVPERFVGRLDLVVSNPPYIPSQVMSTLPREVATFEPVLALDGGSDGLDLFRPLTQWAFRALAPGGGYAVELHETCLDAAAQIACAQGFVEVRVRRDLADRPRVLIARKPACGPECL